MSRRSAESRFSDEVDGVLFAVADLGIVLLDESAIGGVGDAPGLISAADTDHWIPPE